MKKKPKDSVKRHGTLRGKEAFENCVKKSVENYTGQT